MKNPRLILGVLVSLLSLAAQAAKPERVRVTTNLGQFVIELQRDRAPLTVENFLTYVRSGHYTNTLFHRVIAGFVIQGGGVGIDYKAKPNFQGQDSFAVMVSGSSRRVRNLSRVMNFPSRNCR